MKGSTTFTHGLSKAPSGEIETGMNECAAPRSEIIENLKRDIESKENKLEHLLDEKNKAKNENRTIELTNIIRITEQEIKFSKEDLESVK